LTAVFVVGGLVINAQIKTQMEKATTFTIEQHEVMKVVLDMTDAFHKKELSGNGSN
jgi:hypothetical protein